MMDDPYENFTPPPEAPVFVPNEEEFSDPLAYIAKIRPVAEKSGICKIKPPPDWQPPFAVNVDTFRFKPRIQRLNELEAKTRIKLNFLDQLAKFWDLQGCLLRLPHVERRLLDLFTLYKLVEEEGGFDIVIKDKKWNKLATKMGFPSGKGVGGILKSHYERILYPYHVFKNGYPYEEQTEKYKKEEEKFVKEEQDDKRDKDYKPHGIADKTAASGYSRNCEQNGVKKQADFYHCHMCDGGDGDEYMLLCDGCDDAFHIYCLIPPLSTVPKGEWRCPRCVKQACSHPSDPFGFEQSKKDYNLQQFGEMADQFKSNYFNKPVHMVPCEKVEKEFWRLVNSIDEDVTVQYGADIHSMQMGSGFPVKKMEQFQEDKRQRLTPEVEDEEYINSGWNLNNLPVLEQSILGHISGDISGMKVPWCYVGMCFSSFCWHIEDHWSYSINYMHWGEPKTWYGVPSTGADLLESAMKKTAPELFDRSPDLLHHITTIMNPQILLNFGVPIVRTDQHAGEFIITFPRGYHAGFNQGYNFAEAVNFCPADWLPMGRLCIENYRLLHRQCVFSHEELICKMAADPDSLDLQIAAVTYRDMLVIATREKEMRKVLLDKGTLKAEREAFELLPDDERQCNCCLTTCFLSAVTCSCTPNKLVCLHHVDTLCSCLPNKRCLRYRYTLDELPTMMQRLKLRAESFERWSSTVQRVLDSTGDEKFDIHEFKNLIIEVEDKHFPESDLLQSLVSAVGEAEKCASVANQLVSKKIQTRNRQSLDGKHIAKLSLEELNCFFEQVTDLPCIISEGQLIKDLLDRVIDFQADVQEALEAETPDSEKLEQLINSAVTLDVDLPEIPRLKQVLLQARWLDEVRSTLQDPPTVSLDIMRKLMESGVSLAPHNALEKAMAELQELLTVSERWEEKAHICLQARPRHVMTSLEAIINEAMGIPAYLPNVGTLKDALRKAKDWTGKVETVQASESYPYLDVLENIVNKGRPIPVRLDQLPQIESQVSAAKLWRERTARTFLKKNSTFSLLEILSPRSDIGMYSSNKNKKKKTKEGEKDGDNDAIELRVEEHRDPATVVAAFKVTEHKEVESMCQLRTQNTNKLHQDEAEINFCICHKGASGFMLQCELCKDWFHGTCVPLPKSANLKTKCQQVAAMQAARDLKFLCPLCLRSRRPRLETILSLLVSLQKLPVRLAEGEALQCLTERAISWQDRARQALTTTELASALAKLSLLSQRMIEQAAREKTEKIVNAELIKAANNPELQGHLASVTQSAFSGSQTEVKKTDSGMFSMDSDNSLPFPLSPQSSPNSDIEMDVEVISTSNNHTEMAEHSYSSASKANISMNGDASPRKHPRKTPLVPRQVETPILELSKMSKIQLEQMMMEGDLMEVSLDETQHIWRILQECQPRNDEKFLEFQDNELSFTKENKDKDRIIKVKKEKDQIKDGEKKKRRQEEEVLLDVSKPKKNKEEVFITKDGKMILEISKKKYKSKDKDGVKLRKEDNERNNSDKAMKEVESLKIPVEEKIKKQGDKSDKIKKNKLGDKIDKIKKNKPRVNKENGKVVKKCKSKHKNQLGDDEDGDEYDCAAVKCIKPIGDEVNWVQCDRCEEWFHLLCVGLGDDEITEDEEYECFRCKQDVQSLFSEQSSALKVCFETNNLSATESFVKQIRLSAPGEKISLSNGVEVEMDTFSTDDWMETPIFMTANELDIEQFSSTEALHGNTGNQSFECDITGVTMETQTDDIESEAENENNSIDSSDEV